MKHFTSLVNVSGLARALVNVPLFAATVVQMALLYPSTTKSSKSQLFFHKTSLPSARKRVQGEPRELRPARFSRRHVNNASVVSDDRVQNPDERHKTVTDNHGVSKRGLLLDGGSYSALS